MERRKILSLLGIMARARKIDVGTAKIYSGIKKNKYSSIVLATDAEAKTRETLSRLCQVHQIQLFNFGTKEELAQAIGKELTVAIAVKDSGLSNQLSGLFEK